MEQDKLPQAEELLNNEANSSVDSNEDINEEVQVQENPEVNNEEVHEPLPEEIESPKEEAVVSEVLESPENEEEIQVNETPEEPVETEVTEEVAEEAPAQVIEAEVVPTEVVEEPVKKVPQYDFTLFNTEEIISRANELIKDYPVQELRLLDGLQQIFDAQYEKEYNQALAVFKESGKAEEEFTFDETLKERFNKIYKNYRDKRGEYYRKLEEEKENNLKIKLQIIEELKELVNKEESLHDTFQEFKSLQERWKNTGMVPMAKVNDLLETYNLHIDNFYSYIKINKELRDLDFKKNLDAKAKICERAEELSEDSNITGAFRELQDLHHRWKEIGPVPYEQRDTIWDRFKEASDKINNAYHKFFESLKEEQLNNLKIKEELCVKVEEIASKNYERINDWAEATQKVLDLQEEWRRSGTVPQKDRNKLYKKFKAICDNFFNRKREFFRTIQQEQDKNLELKIELCEKVEALKDSTDWKSTTNKIIEYQKQWKNIGPVSRKMSNKIWTRFRSACDFFFNNKNANVKNVSVEQQQNLELKKALIEELRTFQISGNVDGDIEKLKEYQNRWAEIGFVPIRDKNTIQSEFKKLINDLFDQLDINEFDKNLERFKSKINTFDNSEDKDNKIIQEREKLVAKIRQLESDLHVWENNIGFFSQSKNSQQLINDFNAKIEAARHKLSLMQEKLKLIDGMI